MGWLCINCFVASAWHSVGVVGIFCRERGKNRQYSGVKSGVYF